MAMKIGTQLATLEWLQLLSVPRADYGVTAN